MIWVQSSWNVMAHGEAREGKWRWNWWMQWVASTLHTTSEYCVSSITAADAHTSTESSRLDWRPYRFKWTRLFRRKTKSGFCSCVITFQLASTTNVVHQSLITSTRARYKYRNINKTGNVRLNYVSSTIVAVENKYYLFWLYVCILTYPPCEAYVTYCRVMRGLSGSTI